MAPSSNIQPNTNVIAFDFGEKKIGVAIGNSITKTAHPLETIRKVKKSERIEIIENLKMVSGVILFNDDNDTAIEAIKNVKLLYPNDSIIFANGGDRNAINVPETTVPNILFKFGVGGNSKINSSSDLLEQWVNFKNNN